MSTPPTEDQDLHLVERIRAGDQQAFAELIDQYKGMVLNLVARMAGKVENAEDLAQEVFIRVWKGLHNFRGDCKLSTWIYRIALNLAIAESKTARSRSQFLDIDDPVTERGPQFVDEDENPYGQEVRLKEQMIRLLPQMAEKHRTAVVLFYLKQLSYNEISDIMDVPVGTVKSYLFRGKAWLREQMFGDSLEELE
ncbi:MAG: sigma-70 family RNA polymerase sigma factor [Calditrichaeota bacterium]|nr:sigma-70 family RNA polymerase sigma factor [Calditrichota bacterium]MCB9367891.1 sigma-70 family RNA polymerase sigma factor [Calditrichota bacterium]